MILLLGPANHPTLRRTLNAELVGNTVLHYDTFEAFLNAASAPLSDLINEIHVACQSAADYNFEHSRLQLLHNLLAPGCYITFYHTEHSPEQAAALCMALRQVGFDLVENVRGVCIRAARRANIPRQRIAAIMSVPRYGAALAQTAIYRALYGAGQYHDIDLTVNQGVWWHHGITRLMESALADPEVDAILTIDFDSMFVGRDIIDLVAALYMSPYQVLFPLQMRRGRFGALLGGDDMDLRNSIVDAKSGHLGLTLFRRSAFNKLVKPWFIEYPDLAGGWSDDRTDPDITFWKNLHQADVKVGCMPHIPLGHLEEMVAVPRINGGIDTVHLTPAEWAKRTMVYAVPEEV